MNERSEPEVQLAELRDIGWSFWDPIGLLEMRDSSVVRFPEDEYDRYLLEAVAQIRSGADVHTVAAYLHDISIRYMGLEPTDSLEKSAQLTALEIDGYVKRLT